MSGVAERYLQAALEVIEENSVMRSGVDWLALRRNAKAIAGNAQIPQDTYPAIRYVIQQLGDHHSFFQDPAEVKNFDQGIVKNLGFVAGYPSGEIMVVAAGSPAEKASLHVGDLIKQVNGKPLNRDERIPTWVAIDQTVQTQITFQHPGQTQLIQETLNPAEYLIEDMPQGMLLSKGIGYIRLPQLIASTPVTEDYATVANKLVKNLDDQGACGWIVDVRQNRGGNMWPMLAGIGPVLGEGQVGWFIDGHGTRQIWTYHDGQALLDNQIIARAAPFYFLNKPLAPVAVLTGPTTVSSGEAIVIAFRGRPNTRSFGEPTAGLSSANTMIPLSDGAVIVLTVAWESDRTGKYYHGSIPPDQQVAINWLAFGSERDPVIRAATDWLNAQSDCSP